MLYIRDQILNESRATEFDYKIFVKTFLPCIPPTILKDIIIEMKKDLKRIIHHAPEINTKMIVYKSINNKFMVSGNEWECAEFMETTFDINKAINSSKDKNSKCCLKRIILTPGTKCILLCGLTEDSEVEQGEILLSPNTIFRSNQYENKTIEYIPAPIVDTDDDILKFICDESKHQTKVMETIDLYVKN